ncbi:PREDICTED: sodium/bile acid cotransporter 4 [Charadrius vociferus]|nr:PREDICTED: sodium/bile acid cotransporter 4 [Charadrius vociferus]
MTYGESLQQVKEMRTMLSTRYNIFSLCTLVVKICRVPPGLTVPTGRTNSEAHQPGSDRTSGFPEVSVQRPLKLKFTTNGWALKRTQPLHWALARLLPLGAVSLTLGSTLLPIGLGVLIRYRHPRAADLLVKISLWSLLVTLVILFILTGTMLGPDLMAHIPASVYAIAVLMPLAGYALGYGLATVFKMPPHCRRTVSLETGCQNVQLCTAILKLTFPPELIGSMYMFPLLYALFQSAEAGLFVLAYKMYGRDSYKQDTLGEEEDTDISYKKLKEEEVADTSYGTVTTEEHNSIQMEPTQTAL